MILLICFIHDSLNTKMLRIIFTVCQRSCWKVMFSVMSLCQSDRSGEGLQVTTTCDIIGQTHPPWPQPSSLTIQGPPTLPCMPKHVQICSLGPHHTETFWICSNLFTSHTGTLPHKHTRDPCVFTDKVVL